MGSYKSHSLITDNDDPVSQFANSEDAKTEGLPKRQNGLYAETLNLQLALLPNSKLIAFLPKSIAKQGQQFYELEIKKCPFPLPPLTIRGIWHERHQNDPEHQWIRDKISNAFQAVQK